MKCYALRQSYSLDRFEQVERSKIVKEWISILIFHFFISARQKKWENSPCEIEGKFKYNFIMPLALLCTYITLALSFCWMFHSNRFTFGKSTSSTFSSCYFVNSAFSRALTSKNLAFNFGLRSFLKELWYSRMLFLCTFKRSLYDGDTYK